MSNLTDLFNQIQQKPSALFALIALALFVGAIVAIKKVKFTTRIMTQIAIMLALATVLDLFKIYTLPNGGSVTMGSMAPIILLALLYGPEIGLVTGFLYGIISLITGPYILHPVQVLFDYPLAFMALGLAGYVKQSSVLATLISKLTKKDIYSKLVDSIINTIAVVVAIFGRFICAFISGIVFYASDAKGGSPIIYSIVYNGSYLLPDAIIVIIIMIILPYRQIKKAIK